VLSTSPEHDYRKVKPFLPPATWLIISAERLSTQEIVIPVQTGIQNAQRAGHRLSPA